MGKFTIAKWFAKELLLVGVGNEDDRERVEREVDRLIHPDFLALDQLWMADMCEDFDVIAKSSNVPQQHRKRDNAKTNTISIDDIRAIQSRLSEVGSGAHRVCMIRSVERMQDEAVNALLKLLEEPPQGVVFILTSESLSQLLPTLVSRMRILRFSQMSAAELRMFLNDASDDDAQFILRLAQGAPGTVKKLSNDPDLLRAERILYGSAQNFWRQPTLLQRLQILAPLTERGEEAEHLLLHLGLSLRERFPNYQKVDIEAFNQLVRGLRTNAQRQLLVQRFALSVDS